MPRKSCRRDGGTWSHPCFSTHSPWSRSPPGWHSPPEFMWGPGGPQGFTQPWLKSLCPCGAKNGTKRGFYKPLLWVDSRGASLACSRRELMSLRAPKIPQPSHKPAQCRDLLLRLSASNELPWGSNEVLKLGQLVTGDTFSMGTKLPSPGRKGSLEFPSERGLS